MSELICQNSLLLSEVMALRQNSSLPFEGFCEAVGLPGAAECRGYIQHWYGTAQPIPERSAQRILRVADQILRAGRADEADDTEGRAAMTAALCARVSTADQNCENQLIELRRYRAARGWHVGKEFVDQGVSGSKDRRPALDDLAALALRRRIDEVVC